MKCILTFKEISDYVAKNYGRQVQLNRVSAKAVEIKVAQKVLIATIKVPIEVTFEKVEDSQIVISYSGSAGVELLIKGALLFIREKLPQLAPMITNSSDKQLTIDLEKIAQAKSFIDKVRLTGISIDESALEVSAALK